MEEEREELYAAFVSYLASLGIEAKLIGSNEVHCSHENFIVKLNMRIDNSCAYIDCEDDSALEQILAKISAERINGTWAVTKASLDSASAAHRLC